MPEGETTDFIDICNTVHFYVFVKTYYMIFGLCLGYFVSLVVIPDMNRGLVQVNIIYLLHNLHHDESQQIVSSILLVHFEFLYLQGRNRFFQLSNK